MKRQGTQESNQGNQVPIGNEQQEETMGKVNPQKYLSCVPCQLQNDVKQIPQNSYQKVQYLCSLIRQNCIIKASQFMKSAIFEPATYSRASFRGAGFKQVWLGDCHGGPLQWITKQEQQGRQITNQFDLLTLSYIISLSQKHVTIEQLARQYESLLQSMSEYQFQLRIGLGHAYYFNYQFLEAQKCYLEAQKLGSCEILYESLCWVKGYWFQQKVQSVEPYLAKCELLNKDNVRISMLRGLQESEPAEAIARYERLISLDPSQYRVYVCMGFEQPSLEEMLFWFNKALEYDPTYTYAYVRIGLAYYRRQGNIAQAKHYMQKALQVNPQYHLAYWALGQIYQKTDVSLSIQYYERCLQLNPYYLEALENLGSLYETNEQVGCLEQALQIYLRYVELNPYNELVFFRIAIIYCKRGKHEEAIGYFNRTIQLAKSVDNLGMANINISICYYELKDYQQAIVYAKKGYQFDSHEPMVVDIIVECSISLGRYAQAEHWLERWLQISPPSQLKRVYEFYAELAKKRASYPKHLTWQLNLIGASRSLKTEFIMREIIARLGQSESLLILEKEYASKQSDQYYKSLQIALLFAELRGFQRAVSILLQLKQAIQGKAIADEKFKGDFYGVYRSEAGKRSVFDNCMFEINKANFEKQFRQHYIGEGDQ